MLKDPNENERMERVKRYCPLFTCFQVLISLFRWVNNQDFQRASPEPPLPEANSDLFHKFLQPQNAMQILQPHHLLHKVLIRFTSVS